MYRPEEPDCGSPDLTRRSGSVTSSDPLAAFLYELMRDVIPPGDVERLLRNVSSAEVQYTNGWLAEYAKDVARRLRQPEQSPTTPKPF